jgi:hypothetical protein
MKLNFSFPESFRFFTLQSGLLLILLSQTLILSAQEEFHPGYIITSKNDTLYGLVKDRKDAPFAKICKKVRFRDGSLFTKRFSPAEISGYKAGERMYESLWLSIKTDFLRTNYRSIPGMGEKLFMRVVLQDYLSFYELEYLDRESGVIETIPLFKRRDEEHFIRVTQGLLGLRKKHLREYFTDCTKLLENMENGKIKTPLEIAVFYNQNCILVTDTIKN